MQDVLLSHYDWIKSFHVIAVISWMAGIFYLPRLFVYHADADAGSEMAETFKIMERKLLRIIMNPAMIATWLFGILMLAANPAILGEGWFHGKALLVVIMTVFHHMLGRWRKRFLNDANDKPARFYRQMNEVPTVIMILIVVLVIVKPF